MFKVNKICHNSLGQIISSSYHSKITRIIHQMYAKQMNVRVCDRKTQEKKRNWKPIIISQRVIDFKGVENQMENHEPKPFYGGWSGVVAKTGGKIFIHESIRLTSVCCMCAGGFIFRKMCVFI